MGIPQSNRAAPAAPADGAELADSPDRRPRKSRALGLALGWLLILAYAAWLLHNALPLLSASSRSPLGILPAQVIALPTSLTLPGVPLPLALPASLAPIVAGEMAFLFILLLTLTFIPSPVSPPSSALPLPTDVPAPTQDTAPASLTSEPLPADVSALSWPSAPSTRAQAGEPDQAQISAQQSASTSAPQVPSLPRTSLPRSVGGRSRPLTSLRSSSLPSRPTADTEASQTRRSPDALTLQQSAALAPLSLPSVSTPRAPLMQPGATPSSPADRTAPDSVSSYLPRVFISHSRVDDEFGQRLVADLRAALAPDDPGLIWYDNAPERDLLAEGDWDDPGGLVVGQNFVREIVAQIEARNVCIVILSPDAVRSRWVAYEIDQAIRCYNGPTPFGIYPVICRDSAVPSALTIFQTLNLSQALTDPVQYEINLRTLIARVRYGSVAKSDAPPPFEMGVLPVPVKFVGREKEREWMLHRLRQGEVTGVTALRGIGGIGKTALAAIVLRQLHDEQAFPDGIVVVQCDGVTDPVEVLSRALTPFLPGRIAPMARDIAGLSAIAHQHLRNKRALIVLDSIEPGWRLDQATGPLTALNITLLLTARHQLSTEVVPDEGVMELDLLSPDEALLLFAQSYGRRDVAALSEEERNQATTIVQLVGRHTLAVKLAGTYAASHLRPLDTIATELRADLFMLSDDTMPRVVEVVLERSVSALSQEDQRLFAALTAFGLPELADARDPGPIEFGREAMKALAGAMGSMDTATSVDLLVRRALVEVLPAADLPGTTDRERRRLHTVLQAASAKRFRNQLTTTDRRQAQQALADFYAAYAERVSRDNPLAIGLDEVNILRKFDWAARRSDDRLVTMLSNGLSEYWLDSGDTWTALRYLPVGIASAERQARASNRLDDIRRANALKVTYADALRMDEQLTDAERVVNAALQSSQQADDKRTEGLALITLGLIQFRRSEWELAKRSEAEALQCFRACGDRRHEGEAERHLGEIALEGFHDQEAANDHFQRALLIARESGDTLGEGAVLSDLGDAALAQAQWSVAEDYYQQELTLARAGRVQYEVGMVLRALGQVAQARQQWATAETYYRQSLAIRRERADRIGEGFVLTRLGEVAHAQQRWTEAAGYYQQALAIYHALNAQPGVSILLTRLGEVAQAQQQWAEASDYFQQALALDYALDDQQGASVDLVWLGDIARAQEQWATATDYFQQALAIDRARDDQPRVSLILTRLGNVAHAQEQWAAASDYYEQALAIDRALDDQQGASVDLVWLGKVAQAQQQWAEASDYYEQALAIHRALDDLLNQSVDLVWLGDMAQAQKRWAEASDYFQQALAIERARSDQPRESLVLTRLGDVAQAQEQWAQASDYYEQVLTIRRALDDQPGTGRILTRLGEVAQAQQQWTQASDYFQQALVIDRALDDQHGASVDLTRLGEVALAQERWEEAGDYFQQALAIDRAQGYREEEGVATSNLAKCVEAQGHLDRAETLHRESLAIAVETNDAVGTADAQRILGVFLITHDRNRGEGEQLLRQAITRFRQLNMPEDAEEAREKARSLGVELDALN